MLAVSSTNTHILPDQNAQHTEDAEYHTERNTVRKLADMMRAT